MGDLLDRRHYTSLTQPFLLSVCPLPFLIVKPLGHQKGIKQLQKQIFRSVNRRKSFCPAKDNVLTSSAPGSESGPHSHETRQNNTTADMGTPYDDNCLPMTPTPLATMISDFPPCNPSPGSHPGARSLHNGLSGTPGLAPFPHLIRPCFLSCKLLFTFDWALMCTGKWTPLVQ